MAARGGSGQNGENGSVSLASGSAQQRTELKPANGISSSQNNNAAHDEENTSFKVLLDRQPSNPNHTRTLSEAPKAGGRGQQLGGHYRGLSVLAAPVSSRTARSITEGTPRNFDNDSVFGDLSLNSNRSNTQSQLGTQRGSILQGDTFGHSRQPSELSSNRTQAIGIEVNENDSAEGPVSQIGSPSARNVGTPQSGTMNRALQRVVPELQGFEKAKKAWDQKQVPSSVRSESEISEEGDPLKKYSDHAGTIKKLAAHRKDDLINGLINFCKKADQRELFKNKYKTKHQKLPNETELTNFMIESVKLDPTGRYEFSDELGTEIRNRAKVQASNDSRPKSAPDQRTSVSSHNKTRSRSVSLADRVIDNGDLPTERREFDLTQEQSPPSVYKKLGNQPEVVRLASLLPNSRVDRAERALKNVHSENSAVIAGSSPELLQSVNISAQGNLADLKHSVATQGLINSPLDKDTFAIMDALGRDTFEGRRQKLQTKTSFSQTGSTVINQHLMGYGNSSVPEDDQNKEQNKKIAEQFAASVRSKQERGVLPVNRRATVVVTDSDFLPAPSNSSTASKKEVKSEVKSTNATGQTGTPSGTIPERVNLKEAEKLVRAPADNKTDDLLEKLEQVRVAQKNKHAEVASPQPTGIFIPGSSESGSDQGKQNSAAIQPQTPARPQVEIHIPRDDTDLGSRSDHVGKAEADLNQNSNGKDSEQKNLTREEKARQLLDRFKQLNAIDAPTENPIPDSENKASNADHGVGTLLGFVPQNARVQAYLAPNAQAQPAGSQNIDGNATGNNLTQVSQNDATEESVSGKHWYQNCCVIN